MTVSFVCPECGKRYDNIKKELIGKKVRCSCGHVIRIELPNPSGGSATQTSHPDTDIPTVDVKVKEKLVVKDHFNDLDDLLGDYSENVSVPAVATPRVAAAPIPVPKAVQPEPERKRPSSKRLAVGFLAAILSATIAFWFGYLVVSLRFTESDQFVFKQVDKYLTQVNEADFGPEETSPRLVRSFNLLGWTMWGTALGLMLLAVGQFIDAFVQLFTGRRIIGWGDGLVASLGIAFVFLVVATLFMHNGHMASLYRELNQIAPPEGFPESSLENVERIRMEYKSRGREFLTAMLVIAIVPMSVFVFSMVRLFACTGDTKLLRLRS